MDTREIFERTKGIREFYKLKKEKKMKKEKRLI